MKVGRHIFIFRVFVLLLGVLAAITPIYKYGRLDVSESLYLLDFAPIFALHLVVFILLIFTYFYEEKVKVWAIIASFFSMAFILLILVFSSMLVFPSSYQLHFGGYCLILIFPLSIFEHFIPGKW